MRAKIVWGAALVATWLALAPGRARAEGWETTKTGGNQPLPSGQAPVGAWAQGPGTAGAPGPAPSTPQAPLPIGISRPDESGRYRWVEGALPLQTNPLPSQGVARAEDGETTKAGGGEALPSAQAPLVVRAQDMGTTGAPGYAPSDPQIPLPIGSTRPEDGGFYPWVQYTMWRQTNPLRSQGVANRGFLVVDNSIPGVAPHTFFGSGAIALDVQQVTGPNPYQPGFEMGFGWKFNDGSSLSASFLYLASTQNRAVATPVPKGFNVGADLADSFLFSPVFNFPPGFAGPDSKIAVGGPQAVNGIWNGASIMTLEFQQRFQQWDMSYRRTIYDTECYRLSGLMGPRFVWIWERFTWKTTDIDLASNASSPQDVGIYTNIVSNRMYGAHISAQQEWYCGHGFALMLTTEAGLFLDSAKEQPKYETGARFDPPENKRNLREWAVSPELRCTAAVNWYPWESIQLSLGYDLMIFFNTISSPQPISFDYSGLNPKYESTTRLFDGFRVGVTIWF